MNKGQLQIAIKRLDKTIAQLDEIRHMQEITLACIRIQRQILINKRNQRTVSRNARKEKETKKELDTLLEGIK